MLQRMPARWGALWRYFAIGIGGTVLLTSGLAALSLGMQDRFKVGESGVEILVDDDIIIFRPVADLVPRRLHAAQLRLARAEGDRVAKLGWQALQGPPLQALLPLAELTAAERRAAGAMASQPVPRILHQIWIGELGGRGDHAPPVGLALGVADRAAEVVHQRRLGDRPEVVAGSDQVGGGPGQGRWRRVVQRSEHGTRHL